MGWTHRVVKEVVSGPKAAWTGRRDALPARVYYTIREVYDTGAFTSTAVAPGGESLDELRADYTRQARAFEKPVLVVRNGQVIGEEPSS